MSSPRCVPRAHSISFNYGAPPALELIIKKALRKNRDERYQTARDMMNGLRSLAREIECPRLQRQNRTRPLRSLTRTFEDSGSCFRP